MKSLLKLLNENAEQEVEKLLKHILPNSPYKNKAYAVGGYVRDEFMGLEPKDLDIVVELENGSEQVAKYIHDMFPDKISTPRQMGEQYPIWQIVFKDNVEFNDRVFNTEGATIEFADTMTEEFPDADSRQRVVKFGDINKDIERRDFTTNMLLKDLSTGEVVDLTGVSKEDIKNGILRGHPKVSLDKIFNDDPLRMIRLIRFQAKYDWDIPLNVIKTVKRNAERINIVSSERIVGELTKIMRLGKLSQAIKLMKITGLLKHILPEIEELKGMEGGKHHKEGNVFKHTLLVLKNAPHTIEGQLAALLHDVGKLKTQQIINNDIKYYGHEDVGEEMVRAILKRLKFDNETTDKVASIVKNHMRVHELSGYGEKALRKFIRDVGDNMVDAMIDMGEADALGRLPQRIADKEQYGTLRNRINAIRNAPVKIAEKPVLNGEEIMELLNIKPGPQIKSIMAYLKDMADEYATNGIQLDKEKAKELVLKKFK